jgi:hypothetical protein
VAWNEDKPNRPEYAILQATRLPLQWRLKSFFSVADHFATEGALIDASEVFFHRGGEQ